LQWCSHLRSTLQGLWDTEDDHTSAPVAVVSNAKPASTAAPQGRGLLSELDEFNETVDMETAVKDSHAKAAQPSGGWAGDLACFLGNSEQAQQPLSDDDDEMGDCEEEEEESDLVPEPVYLGRAGAPRFSVGTAALASFVLGGIVEESPAKVPR
jgi:hypothetical protein